MLPHFTPSFPRFARERGGEWLLKIADAAMISPDYLENLAAYVPTPVAHAIYRQPRLFSDPTARRFPAAVLLADISGFTPLSELLSRAGPTGAEELTQVINQYFALMIQLLEAYRGQVIKFSGDAIIALFRIGLIQAMQLVCVYFGHTGHQ